MQKKDPINKQLLLRAIIIMLITALVTFFIFYILLIDSFNLFVHDTSETKSTAEQNSSIDEVLPTHGEEAEDTLYPKEELSANIRSATQWIQSWFLNSTGTTNERVFPLKNYADFIATLQRLQNTITSMSANTSTTPVQQATQENTIQQEVLTPLQILTIMKDEVTQFTDSLLLSLPAAQREALQATCLQNIMNINTVLESLQALSQKQKEQFTKLLTLEQKVMTLQQEVEQLRTIIQQKALENDQQLPRLAERLFNLQSTLENAQLTLKHAQGEFGFFYLQATIRYLPPSIPRDLLSILYNYTTYDNWEQFVTLLHTDLTTLASELQIVE